MHEYSNDELFNCGNNLLRAMGSMSNMITTHEKSNTLRTEHKQKVEQLEKEIGDLRECGNHLNNIWKNVQSYAVKHQQAAKDILDVAIREAGYLVPDADAQGIHLETTKARHTLVLNGKGQNVNMREGCGYRAVLGALIRYACIKAQPDAIPLMLYDEYFFTLSDTTSVAMKDVFQAMKKDVAIICIEQRRNAMDGIVDKEFTFKKGLDKISRVERTL